MSSLIEPTELFKRVKELGQTSVALTDLATLVGGWSALKAAKQTGVKLIIGEEFHFVDDFETKDRLRSIVLLAMNEVGYQNLLELHKQSYDHFIVAFKKVHPRIDWTLLEKYNEGLICLTGGGQGILAQLINNRKAEEAKIQAQRLQKIFGDRLGLEIQAHGLRRNITPYNSYEDQALVNRTLITWGEELGIKVVATAGARMLEKSQAEALDVALAIGSGQPVNSGARLKFNQEFYLKSREEMEGFFSRLYKDKAKQFCDNAVEFAERCEHAKWIDPGIYRPAGVLWDLPDFPVQNQSDYQDFLIWKNEEAPKLKIEDAYLRYSAFKVFDETFKHIPSEKLPEYRSRVERELKVFFYKKLSSYMLIVADIINWAKRQNIPVGPGRGSASSSLIGYLLGIHTADPIKYGLFFERFYNMEKSGLSDIDMDFAQYGKPLVEEYVVNKYGRDNCAQITNYIELTSKPYTKAISRAFMFGGDRKSAVRIGNEMSSIIPDDIKKVKNLIEEVPLFAAYAESPQYQPLGKFVDDLGNKVVARSTHAAAMIIASKPIHQLVPVRRDSDGTYSIEYYKDDAEANGLAKMDLLGISTLDIIQNTFNLIKSRNKPLPSIPWNYDENDKKTYDLIKSGDNYGIFQLGGSAGTVELCIEVAPSNIEELAMINALTRPGVPKEARKAFILTKQGKRKMQIAHPCLKRSLEPTLGFPLYDEILLTLATDVAGWDLNEADRLRKFVKDKGKNPEKDEKLQEDFVNGAIKNTKLQPRTAQKIWDEVVASYAKYAFNKSHAITYSFIGYQTAYLKAHYPLEFLICNLSFESSSGTQKSEDNILQIKREIRAMGVKILPPDINKSEYTYTIIDDQTILTGFDSMKYMGKDAIPEIIKHRPFNSFQDFLSKVDHKKVKAPAIQALAASGALDNFGLPRKVMFLYSHDFKKKFAAWMKKEHKLEENFQYPFPDLPEWNANEKAALELKYLGEMLTTDYRSVYPNFFSRKVANFAELSVKYAENEEKNIELDAMDGNVEGMVSDFYEFKIKNPESKIYGQLMAKMTVQDLFGNSFNVTFFPEALNNFKRRVVSLMGKKFVLEAGCSIALLGSVSWYKGKLGVNFNDLRKIGIAPPLPDNLTPQKVSMKIGGKKKKIAESSVEELLEEVNEELVEKGVNIDQEEIFDNIFEPEDLESDIELEKD